MPRLFHSANHPPLRPVETTAAGEVLETLERCRLDPEEVLLVGSAALALYGVILDKDPLADIDRSAKRPGDVDVLSTGSYAQTVYEGMTHEGMDVRLKTKNTNTATILRVDSSPLPLDVITYYNSLRSMEKFDTRFRKRISRESRVIEGTGGIRIATTRKLDEELAGRIKDPKAMSDLANLRSHLGKK